MRPRESLPFLHLVPNLVTILGMCAGLSAIRFAWDGRFELAAALVVLAALLDGIDGLLARKLNAASSFGAELDSFADFVSFGVAPGLLVYAYALTGPAASVGWVFVLTFAVCACLRLARFNISRATSDGAALRHFVGVPAPAGAMLGLMPVFVGLADLFDPSGFPILTAFYLGFVGVLMISRLPTPSLKAVRIQRRNAGFVLVGVTLFIGLLLFRTWLTLVLSGLAYLALLAGLGFRVAQTRKSGGA